jgi:hypothetical protein
LIKNKEATGDDDESGNVIKFLGEDGFKIKTRFIKNIYETEE